MSQGGILNFETNSPIIPTLFPTDNGTAVPAANTLNILGGLGISTEASGNTITINLESTTALTFVSDSGSATPSSNLITFAGDIAQGISSSASDSTVMYTIIDASTTMKGVASFNNNNFSLSAGAVSSKPILLIAGTGMSISGTPVNLGGVSTISLSTPVSVTNGGTGDSSFTAYAPITGGTTSTSALQSATTGFSNSGYVFVSNGSSALPSWQNLSSIGVTSITGTANQIAASASVGAVTLSLTNGISVGSYQAISPPSGGLIMPGKLSIGSSSIASTYFAQISPALTTGDATQCFVLSPTFTSSIVTGYTGITAIPIFSPPTGVTYASAYGMIFSGSLAGTGTGTATLFAGIASLAFVDLAAGTVPDSYGIISYIPLVNSGIATNAYGLYSKGTLGGLSTPVNAYGLYVEKPTVGSSANITAVLGNAAGSKVGIGVTSPSAGLHLLAGTTAASTAPLKFITGSNLTSPEAGTMEFSSSVFYLTPSATRLAIALMSSSFLTNHGVALGTGASTLSVTSVGSTGQLLVGNTGADPTWQTASSILVTSITATAPITASASVGDITIALTTPLAVGFGGTGTATTFTAGSVVFAGASGIYSQDNANFFWDDSNNRLGIGTASPQYPIHSVNTSVGALAYPLFLQNSDTTVSTATGILFCVSSTVGAAKGGIAYLRTLGNGRGDIYFLQNAVADTSIADITQVVMTIKNSGNIGIGTTGPTAVLQLKAGTASASTAPLKFTTGTNLTTGEAGAMEYSSSVFYLTPSGTTRLAIALMSSSFLTNHGIALGAGTSTLSSTSAGTAGQILVSGGSSADPTWTSSTFPTTCSQGDIFYGSASNVISTLAKDTNATRYLSNTGTTNNPAWAQINLANGVTGTLVVGNGGTGAVTFTAFSIICAGTTATGAFQNVVGVGTAGQLLVSGGAGALPVWTSSTFPSTCAQGDIFYGSATNVISALAKSTTATRYLSNTGTTNNPAWAQVDLTNGVTGVLPNANTTATSANTVSTIVARDGSGNFSAGTITADLSGNATTATTATNVATADEAADTSCFLAFVTASGTQASIPVKTNTTLTYNSSTNNVGATTFTGALTGNASTATALQNARTIGGVSFNGTANIVPQTITSNNEATDTSCFLLFITASGTQSLQPKNNTGLTYNSNTNNVGATTFTGALSGNATTATTLATARNIGAVSFDGSAAIVPQTIQTVDDTTDATSFVLFVGASGTQAGGQQPKTNSVFTWDAVSNILSVPVVTLNSAADTSLNYNESGSARWTISYSIAGNYLYQRDAQNSRDLLQLYDSGFTAFPNGSVVVGATSVDASAQLQADSTTKGFLPPRMTTTQKNAIGTPAAGLIVFDTSLSKLCVYSGAAWQTITSV